MKLLFLDTETTGIDNKKCGIVQISGIIEIDGEIKEEFDFHCRPFANQIYESKALEVIGKTIEEIKQYPWPREVYLHISTIFNKYVDRFNKTDKFTLVGQNVKFDYDFMNQWFTNCGNRFLYGYISYHVMDLMCLSNIFKMAGLINPKNMKLGTLAEYFNIELKAHDSLADIRVTRELFYKFLSMVKK